MMLLRGALSWWAEMKWDRGSNSLSVTEVVTPYFTGEFNCGGIQDSPLKFRGEGHFHGAPK